MASFNKVILMGNLTRDPELRQSQSGNWVAKAGIAVNERVPDGQGGYRDEAHFFDLTLFGRQAESFGKWFHKGSPVLVEGRLNYGSWEDRETGQKRSKVDVVVLRWHFVGGREDASSGDGGGRPPRAAASPTGEPPPQEAPSFPQRGEFVPDDVPF